MKGIENTISSIEVAEMVGRRHDHVLRDINKIIDQLGDPKIGETYFSVDTYLDSQRKPNPCFRLSKKGCELFSTRMTGSKGTKFAVAYIERFNEMEIHIKDYEVSQLADPRERLKLMYQFQENTAERVDVIEADLHEIKENQLLNEPDYSTISKMVRRKVNTLCTEQHLNQPQKAELFKDLNGGIKKITGVIARNRIKAKDFDKVIEFINMWQPSTATLTIIKQMSVFE